jgi:hypothetical protein
MLADGERSLGALPVEPEPPSSGLTYMSTWKNSVSVRLVAPDLVMAKANADMRGVIAVRWRQDMSVAFQTPLEDPRVKVETDPKRLNDPCSQIALLLGKM